MRFGILSTAEIGLGTVIPAIQQSSHDVTAICSRDADRARAVADDLGIEQSFGDYETLLAEADVDALYNPLPNGLHAEWTKRAADHGLHILCEKPFAVDAAEAADVFEYCDDQGVTVMEAFMYHFHPRTKRAREIVTDELGEIRSVEATFNFRLDDLGDIRLDPALAGGSLMDVGCYAVSATRNFIGEPARVSAVAVDSRDSGVDTKLVSTFAYGDDRVATVNCGFDSPHCARYRVDAVDGWLEATNVFDVGHDESPMLTYSVDGREVTETFDPVDHYTLQAEGFAEAVESGDEPPVSRAETMANMRVIDALTQSAQRRESVDVPTPT